MSNSSLVSFTKISPNKTVMTNKKNTHIVIHHMAGNLTVEQCGNTFASSARKASSNYGIDTKGNVGMYVEEKDRSWATSSKEIDSKAVTIEVANDKIGGDWHVSDKALKKLIELCADICKRNGIKKLNFTGDKTGNLHAHKWYASTACPGPYLYSKFGYIADEVNKILSKNTTSTKQTTKTTSNKTTTTKFKEYKVKVTANALNVRSQPDSKSSINTVIKKGEIYTIVEEKNKFGKLKSGAGWIMLKYVQKI